MMSANIIDLIGAEMVVRCGHIQPDHSSCGRRLAVWMLEGAGPEDGGWRLQEKVPTIHGADRVRGQRVSYSCHPKRCGAKYDLRLAALTPRVLEGMQSGRTELWLGDRTEWWFA
jgi:hypothetical protein